MLTAYPASTPTLPSPASGGGKGGGAHAAGKASWLDLLDPTPEERATVERNFGLELPSRDDLSEVESSSRIAEENGLPHLPRRWWIGVQICLKALRRSSMRCHGQSF